MSRGTPFVIAIFWYFTAGLSTIPSDSSPTIRSWAQYILAGLAPSPAKAQQVQEMSRSADWLARLMAGLRVSELGPETRKAVLTELSNDAEPATKDYASAMLETMASPTTAPSK